MLSIVDVSTVACSEADNDLSRSIGAARGGETMVTLVCPLSFSSLDGESPM